MLTTFSEEDYVANHQMAAKGNLHKMKKETTFSQKSPPFLGIWLLATVTMIAICLTAVTLLHVRLNKLETAHQEAVLGLEKEWKIYFQVRLALPSTFYNC